jgi:glycosyltransferase involved in cell wall biosynthesis
MDRCLRLGKEELKAGLRPLLGRVPTRTPTRSFTVEHGDGSIAKVPVSILLPVRNEELNLEAALQSVAWADEIWVVDSHSADRTWQIAEASNVRPVQFEYHGEGPKKKNWSLENLPFRNAWVLILDADERIPPALADEIRVAIASDAADGYYIDRDFIFQGRSLHSCRPNWNMRLFKHKLGRYELLGTNVPNTGDNEVHEHVVLNGREAYLRVPLIHRDFRPLRAWVENHNRYSEWEASVYRELGAEPLDLLELFTRRSVWRRRVLKRLWVRLPLRPLARFLLYYFVRRGFLDGRQGFAYAVLMGYYEFLVGLKMKEMSTAS